MKIHIYEIDDNLILEYVRIIKALEDNFNAEMDFMRRKLHTEIMESVGVAPSGYRRDDRLFMTALNHVVVDLMYPD